MGHSRPLFLYFRLFNTQLTVYKCSILINFCRWLDSNRGPLVVAQIVTLRIFYSTGLRSRVHQVVPSPDVRPRLDVESRESPKSRHVGRHLGRRHGLGKDADHPRIGPHEFSRRETSCQVKNFKLHCLLHTMWPDWAIYWTLGNFLKPLVTIILPKSTIFLGNFCQRCQNLSFFGNFYRHLAIFFRSHWLPNTIRSNIKMYFCLSEVKARTVQKSRNCERPNQCHHFYVNGDIST